jgi:hypothetical protein
LARARSSRFGYLLQSIKFTVLDNDSCTPTSRRSVGETHD